jgi:hypothetical protein
MKVIHAAGLGRAFSLEWISAAAETRDARIDEYLSVIERSIEHGDRLVSGTLEIGARAEPQAHRLPAVPLGGARDHITPPARVFAPADHVSTPRADVEKHVNPAGTSASSWAPKHCASTGRRCWPASTSARAGDPDTAAAQARALPDAAQAPADPRNVSSGAEGFSPNRPKHAKG